MRRKLSSIFAFLALGLCAGAWRIYQARERERVPGRESLDNPAVAAAFNRVAGWPQMRVLRRYVIHRVLRLARQGQAIDIGCGPGHLLFELARQAPSLQLTGIDLSGEVLAQAEAASSRLGLEESVEFKRGSADAIPYPDGSFDLVISTLSLHHWSRPTAVLDEVARVLRPGGAFVIFDLRRDMAPPFYVLLWFASRVVVPKALREANEPLASRNAAHTVNEAVDLAGRSQLTGWRVEGGPVWLIIEGRKAPGRMASAARA